MFDHDVIAAIEKVAAETGMERAALLAVAEVESGGRAFARVAGRREPLIRFEGHYFDRRLSGDKQARARAAVLVKLITFCDSVCGIVLQSATTSPSSRDRAARWIVPWNLSFDSE